MVDQGLKNAIKNTLTYSQYFHYPLTLPELHNRLINYQVSKSSLAKIVNTLLKSRFISQQNSYYFLPQMTSLVRRRKLYSHLSKPLFDYTESLIPILTRISSIRAIYLTGSLAMQNTDGHDDIDLMIIAESKKLWITRLLLTIYTTLLGLRRTRKTKNVMGKLCLNLYLTPDSYAVPPHLRSLYTAYELIQAVPLYDPKDTHALLLSSNSWLKSYLPNYPLPKPKNNQATAVKRALAENICYWAQLLYMKGRITREYITKDAAFFHPNNPGRRVLSKIKI